MATRTMPQDQISAGSALYWLLHNKDIHMINTAPILREFLSKIGSTAEIGSKPQGANFLPHPLRVAKTGKK
jgi:hypothetical protein